MHLENRKSYPYATMIFTEAVAKLKNLALINASLQKAKCQPLPLNKCMLEVKIKFTRTVQEIISSGSEKTSQQVQTNVINQRDMKMKQSSKVKN